MVTLAKVWLWMIALAVVGFLGYAAWQNLVAVALCLGCLSFAALTAFAIIAIIEDESKKRRLF